MLYKAWMVVGANGNAVFLDHTRAMEYAGQHHGIVITLTNHTPNVVDVPFREIYVKEAPNNLSDIRQEGKAVIERCEQLHEDTSASSGSSSSSGNTCQTNVACGDSCACTATEMEPSPSTSNNPL